jgi:CheY-like chemotaxis protein
VLIVEDDPNVRHLVDTVLTRLGHHTLLAASANEASANLIDFEFTPQSALLDVVLLGMSGIEFGRLLRRLFPPVHLVFMTGWPDAAILQNLPRDTPLIRKPFTISTLLVALRLDHPLSGPTGKTDAVAPPG